MYAVLKRLITPQNANVLQPAYDQYTEKHRQFLTSKSTLRFSDNSTLFSPDSLGNPQAGFFETPPIVGQNDIVYTNYTANQVVAKKQVFNQTYLLLDTMSNIKWKLTGETREIGGYVCYRANGLVLDSIYAVAFYTYEIPVSGGPESFSGLPGMILEVVLPHENVSWVARQVVDLNGPSSEVHRPSGGIPVDKSKFLSALQAIAKQKDVPAYVYLIGFLL